MSNSYENHTKWQVRIDGLETLVYDGLTRVKAKRQYVDDKLHQFSDACRVTGVKGTKNQIKDIMFTRVRTRKI